MVGVVRFYCSLRNCHHGTTLLCEDFRRGIVGRRVRERFNPPPVLRGLSKAVSGRMVERLHLLEHFSEARRMAAQKGERESRGLMIVINRGLKAHGHYG